MKPETGFSLHFSTILTDFTEGYLPSEVINTLASLKCDYIDTYMVDFNQDMAESLIAHLPKLLRLTLDLNEFLDINTQNFGSFSFFI